MLPCQCCAVVTGEVAAAALLANPRLVVADAGTRRVLARLSTSLSGVVSAADRLLFVRRG